MYEEGKINKIIISHQENPTSLTDSSVTFIGDISVDFFEYDKVYTKSYSYYIVFKGKELIKGKPYYSIQTKSQEASEKLKDTKEIAIYKKTGWLVEQYYGYINGEIYNVKINN